MAQRSGFFEYLGYRLIIGYTLYGSDNDSFMVDEDAVDDFCQKCGYLKHFDHYNPLFKVNRKGNDLSCPYDVGFVVSARFREFCIRQNYSNIVFKEFEREFGYFQLQVHRILTYDPAPSKTEFSNYCSVCQNYEEVIGVTPTTLRQVSEPLDDGFYRTDLVFGSGNSKNPILIVGVKTEQKLRKEKMKGLIYRPIVVS